MVDSPVGFSVARRTAHRTGVPEVPEGPEIKRAADKLAEAVQGERARYVFFGLPAIAHHAAELEGTKVLRVSSRSKAMLVDFDCDLTVYSHNQLYGRWYTCAPQCPPTTSRQLRFALHTDKRWALLYSASEIAVIPTAEVEQHPYIAKLGPDLLNQRVTLAQLERRYNDVRFGGRSLGALLLDQGFIAGIGNYLRCEILFHAGVHPATRPRDLTGESVTALAMATRVLIKRAYASGGVTVSAKRFAAAKAAGEHRHGARFAVFDRGGLACIECGTEIASFRHSGRRCYACPTCQPRRWT